MGADGFIVDPSAGVFVEIRCYACSRPVWEDSAAIEQHEDCVARDGRLPVNVEIMNYEER